MLAPKTARLFSLLAFAMVVPLLGLYALLMKVSSPGPDGGMDPTSSMICYFAFTFLFGALIIVAVDFARQMSREAKGERQTP
ncbi:MAG: hypothetical protein IPP90_08495 [Gemmatimonadaceae bacterium]|nr:hypothetical protein [Gemmatimonadaceae bacterium]